MTSSAFSRFALLAAAASAAAAQPPVLLDAMSQELNRNFSILKEKADPAPYFLSYEVSEQEYRTISASLGSVTANTGSKGRALDVSVRVGTPQLDNYHRVGGAVGQVTSGAAISIEDNANSIKRRLWLETDRAYRVAAARLIGIKTNTQVRVAASDSSADFSKEEPSTSVQPPPPLKFDQAAWTERVRRLSARFGGYSGVLTSRVDSERPDRYALFRGYRGRPHRARAGLRARGDLGVGQGGGWHGSQRIRDV